MARTARFMTSGRRGVSKTAGSAVSPVGFPWRSKIFAVFCVGIGLSPLFSLGGF